MKKYFKKLTAILLIFCLICSLNLTIYAETEYNTDEVSVYITVTDITDYNNPINVLVPRHKIKVSNFNLADFGDTLKGLTAVEGITYLHALVQLHRNFWGDAEVQNKLILTEQGYTKYFMGKSVANVMYKNGRDIFAFPQMVNIDGGDEIQICLYDESHSQAVATFLESRIDDVALEEEVDLTLYQHYSYPRNRNPIKGAEICDEKGLYYTDSNGDIITTDSKGNFTVSFDEAGSYTLSAMPEINYYILDTGGGIKVEWIPQTTIKEVEYTYTEEAGPPWVDIYADTKGGDGYISSAEGKALYNAVFDDGSQDNIIVLFDWDNTENLDDSLIAIIATEMPIVTKTGTRLEEVTELVKVETVIPDELQPMVTYTTPLVTINVTGELLFVNNKITFGTNTARLTFDTKNLKRIEEDYTCYVATYSDDGMLIEVKTLDTLKEYSNTVTLTQTEFSYLKIFCWNDMKPLCSAEMVYPTVEPMSLDWDYTMPTPENVYITQPTE